ncbi:hypothetical protein Tco_0109530 [Tanacetum coccineum]
MEECHLLLTDQIDLVNLEGNQVVPDGSKPLPLGGPPSQLTIQTQYFFNKDLEYLMSGSKERRSDLSISKLKAAHYPDFGLEELVPSLWIESERDYNISTAYSVSHTMICLSTRNSNIQQDTVPTADQQMIRETEVLKFSNGTLTRILEKLDVRVKDYMLFKFNPGMVHRIWSEDDKRRSKEFIEVIKRRLKIKRIFRSLEL